MQPLISYLIRWCVRFTNIRQSLPDVLRYTGDILDYKDTGERYLRKYVVEKDEDTEYYYYLTIEERYFVDRIHGMEDEYLVIGNIYENKELLEE